MKVRVRRAEEKDIPMILELLTQVCNVHSDGRPDLFKRDEQKYHKEELEILLKDDTRPIFVGVDENDEVLGYGFCVLLSYEGSNVLVDRRELYIDDLCVHERARGLGVGKQIFSYIKSFAKEAGCYHLTLNVWASNETAMRFYEAQGMRMLKKEMEVIL